MWLNKSRKLKKSKILSRILLLKVTQTARTHPLKVKIRKKRRKELDLADLEAVPRAEKTKKRNRRKNHQSSRKGEKIKNAKTEQSKNREEEASLETDREGKTSQRKDAVE